ncbi:hypothetical protein KSB_70830 [Ktedonobacter robiniae]|uniref:Uncharacterized protein n=1 Tax=Ktedonobacter robiniae TaxID=2778365 RepID=A0ABQ3V114_9CHLR|nr:hypothetical protein KSB_70830 [Ktedonobacter robiniae]
MLLRLIYYFSEHPEREALDTLVALRPRMGVGFRNKILVCWRFDGDVPGQYRYLVDMEQ